MAATSHHQETDDRQRRQDRREIAEAAQQEARPGRHWFVYWARIVVKSATFGPIGLNVIPLRANSLMRSANNGRIS